MFGNIHRLKLAKSALNGSPFDRLGSGRVTIVELSSMLSRNPEVHCFLPANKRTINNTCRHITHTDLLPAPDTMELQPALTSTVTTANNESLTIFLHGSLRNCDTSYISSTLTGLHRKQSSLITLLKIPWHNCLATNRKQEGALKLIVFSFNSTIS